MTGPGPTVTRETIGPEQATEYLKANTHNRPLRPGRVNRWADTINRGAWLLTHQGIAFDTGGTLLDGQHRLAGIVEAGQPVDMHVWRNVDPATYDRIDTGMPRRAADVLTAAAIPDAAMVAAAGRLCLAWETIPRDAVWSPRNSTFDNDEVAEWVGKHPEIGEWAARGRALRKPLPVTISSTTAALWVIAGVCTDDQWEPFYAAIRSGANLGPRDARLALRNWLLKRDSQRGIQGRQQEIAVWVKAWNRWLANGEVMLMTWRNTEGMPTPVRPPRLSSPTAVVTPGYTR